jgi:hypothetical protein
MKGGRKEVKKEGREGRRKGEKKEGLGTKKGREEQ